MPQFRYIRLCTPVPGGGCDAHGPGCPTPGKRPLEADWANSWSRERPEGNCGVLTGPEAGLLVIDVDTAEAWDQYEAWGLPETFTVQSGRIGVGFHMYYRWPAGLERVPNRLDGVEIKGPGRQVVAWDSLHASGNRYQKLGGAFATLPESFVERLRSGTAQHSLAGTVDATVAAQERLAEILESFPDAVELPDGNWECVCPAHADHDPSLVITASENRILVHCRAGCPVEEVFGAVGLPLSGLWAREPMASKKAPVSEPVKRRLGAAGGVGDRFSLSDLMSATLPDVRWAVPGLVPEGLTLLAGPPKLGKSWFVLDMAISLAAGRPFLGRDVEAGDCLYLALEDNPRRLQGRARTVLGGTPAPQRLELWTRAGSLGGGLILEIEEWLDAQPEPRLVIIDTLGRVQEPGSGESKDGGYADAVTALAELQAVAAERGVAVVVITHTKKGGWANGADPLEAVLGSQGYAGTADSILVLKRERGEATGELFVTGREIQDEQVVELTFDGVTCRWSEGGELTVAQAVLKLLREEPYKWTGTGVANKTHRRKAEVLAELERLELAGQAMQVTPKDGGWPRWGLPVTTGATP